MYLRQSVVDTSVEYVLLKLLLVHTIIDVHFVILRERW